MFPHLALPSSLKTSMFSTMKKRRFSGTLVVEESQGEGMKNTEWYKLLRRGAERKDTDDNTNRN
jgi:hypothetical protein